jgi:hypothetical protein
MGCIVAECAVVMVDCRMIDHIRYTVRGKQESGDDGREWDNCAQLPEPDEEPCLPLHRVNVGYSKRAIKAKCQ